jgi:serine/threonine-protein kinase
MLFELLTGRQPFEGEQAVQVAYQHANETVPAPSKINQQVPAVVDQLVLWATAKDQTERPSDANELLVAVKQIKADLRAGTATINIPKPSTAAPEAIAATTVLGDLTNATQVFPSNATQVFPSNANQTEALGFEANATQVLGNLEYSTEADQSVSRSNFGTPRRGLKLLIAMIVVALLGSATGWYFGSGPGGFKAIPNLSSRSVSDARAALTPFGAEVQVIREASSLTSKDLVIRTEPGAGSLYFTGPIKLIVSSGPKSMSVPNLKGMDVATATAKLLTSGFALGTVSSWFSTSPAGQVYDYLGADGSSVPEGTAIELKVSLGSIPVVAGLDQALAIGMIQAAGLKVSKVSQEFSDTVASGQVISVLPISEPLGAGGEVNLIVSKGPNVVLMPAVIGETLAAAKSALESLGLTVVVDTNQLQSKWGIAKVKRVSVAAGTALKSGDQVTIYSK